MCDIKVSICCLAYNHESYIRQCLDGFMIQKCNFKFEVLIHDDASKDKTASIIEEYANKYPEIIKPIYQTENQHSKGVKATITFNFPRIKGKYVAMCEGDDYWTDPYKLQKQVDFLEANPDYVLSFHRVKILQPNGDLVEDFITKVPENYETQETLARLGNYIHTPSVVFRNVLKELPNEFSLCPIGDYFIYMLLTEHGKLKYFEEEMAVYRQGVGIWSAKSEYFRNLKTAQAHALIVSAMSNFPLVVKILNERISSFIERFKNKISPEDLLLLNTSKAVEEVVFFTLLKDNNILDKNTSIDSYTSKQLLEIVFKRIKKRLLK